MPDGDTAKPPVPPKLHASGEELYNMLMSRIEPELTTDQLPTLREKYKDETPDQARARARRYAHAFVAYDRALEENLRNLDEALRRYRKEAFASVEAEGLLKEEEELKDLEELFSS